MKVKFSNTEVDLYRVRQGAVVVEWDENSLPCLFHIKNFVCVSEDQDGSIFINVEDACGEQQFNTKELFWVGD